MKTTPEARATPKRCADTKGIWPVLAVFALLLAPMAVLGAGAGSGAEAQTPGTVTYTVEDLGTLEGSTIARGVNASGRVVGQSQKRLANGSLGLRAFFWDGGPMTDLGTLGDPTTAPNLTSAGRGINDAGRVVGFSRVSTLNNQQRAFVAERDAQGGTRMVPLGTLPGYASSEAWAINESGQIVGRSSSSPTSGRAFLYRRDEGGVSAIESLGVLSPGDTYSEAWAINDSGQVVGESGSHEDTGKAFLYSGGGMKGLGTLPGQPYSEAMGINDTGRIVGWSYSSRANVQGRAFLYKDGVMEDLGTLPGDLYSMARAIDERGRVVGQSRNAGGQNRAFLWEDGKMTDLNAAIPTGSPLRLLDAYAISESGKIVGSALNKDGQVRAFLLTPNDTTAPNTAAKVSPDPNAAGWNREDVTITLSATDEGGSNVEGITYSATGARPIGERTVRGSSAQLGVAAEGETTVTYSARDHAGNASGQRTLTVRLDKTAPEISVSAPTDGAEYRLGETLAAGYACTDGGSGVTSCLGPIPDGNNIDTASVGPKTFTVEAADDAGNIASENHTYGVVYDFGGFFSPVDNPDVLNRVQAGSAVPAKFGLSGNQGLDIFAEGYPRSQRIGCDSTATVDNIEQTVGAGESGLTYDAAADQYSYVWKTSKAWGDTCRQLVVKLDDGTVHQANFRFK
jgi:probable HAF family extracellular repeat protein